MRLLLVFVATFAITNITAAAPQKISFKTKDGKTLQALYEAPQKGKAVVVMLHGMASSKEEWLPLIKELRRKGVGSLAYDARGHAESSLTKDANGNPDGYKAFGAPGPGTEWEQMVDDVGMAFYFLQKEKKIAREQLRLAGASLGANVALQYASLVATMPKVLALSPGLNYFEFRPEQSFARIKGGQVLIVASAADAYSYQSSITLKQRFSFVQLWTDVKPGHGVQMFDDRLLPRLVEWLASPN